MVGKKKPILSLGLLLVVSSAFVVCVPGPRAWGEKVYWTNATDMTIERADIDGSNVEVVVTITDRPGAMAVDRAGGKMYWVCDDTPKIQRANLDGSGVEDLVTTGLVYPGEIALDLVGGKMYWTDQAAGKIQRANLDGTGMEDIVASGLSRPLGIAVDGEGGQKVYWTDWTERRIQRANLDGSGVEVLVTVDVGKGSGMALDLVHGKMYWTTPAYIRRANLDGSAAEIVVGGTIVLEALSIDLDVGSDKLYWTRSVSGNIHINRHNLDGSDDTVLLTTSGRTSGMRLLLRPGDADRDGDVDINDYVVFTDCLSGPNVTPTPEQTTLEQCWCVFDFDSDLDVDSSDYAAFSKAFTH